jgi:hypothetical protein
MAVLQLKNLWERYHRCLSRYDGSDDYDEGPGLAFLTTALMARNVPRRQCSPRALRFRLARSSWQRS